MSHPLPRLLLFLDFDSTLTTTCTLPTFLSIPHALSAAPLPSSFPTPSSLLTSYLSDLRTHKTPSSPAPAFSAHLPSPAPFTLLTTHNALRPLEARSFHRGRSLFLATHTTRSQIHSFAIHATTTTTTPSTIHLRPGWQRALQHPQIHTAVIISAAWSPDWIRGVLGPTTNISIRCNDVLASATASASAKEEEEDKEGIFVSADKLRLMNQFKQQAAAEEEEVWTIYIGDSLTDLECLLAADVSIVMTGEGHEQRELRTVLAALDVPVYGMEGFGQVQVPEGKVVWVAGDFDEVVESGCFEVEGRIWGRSVW